MTGLLIPLLLLPVTTRAACGDGALDMGEECDDGGICVGGANAGASCRSEEECAGDGRCDGGVTPFHGCRDDGDCGLGQCRHCTAFGGDGCAANCTHESDIVWPLLAGMSYLPHPPEGSYLKIHSQIIGDFTAGIEGAVTLTIGKDRGDGLVPVVWRNNALAIPAFYLGQHVCACLRGGLARTCGAVLLETNGAPGIDCSINGVGEAGCAALGAAPCANVYGPGNSASGVLSCIGGLPTDITQEQDSHSLLDDRSCHSSDVYGSRFGELPHIGFERSTTPGSLQLSAQVLLAFRAFSECNTACTVPTAESKGANLMNWFTTGKATATVTNADGEPNATIGPYEQQGVTAACSDQPSGHILVANNTALNQCLLGDIVSELRLSTAPQALNPPFSGVAPLALSGATYEVRAGSATQVPINLYGRHAGLITVVSKVQFPPGIAIRNASTGHCSISRDHDCQSSDDCPFIGSSPLHEGCRFLNPNQPDCHAAASPHGAVFSYLPRGCNGNQCTGMRVRVRADPSGSVLPDGELYRCNWTTRADTQPGTYPLTLTDIHAFDETSALVEFTDVRHPVLRVIPADSTPTHSPTRRPTHPPTRTPTITLTATRTPTVTPTSPPTILRQSVNDDGQAFRARISDDGETMVWDNDFDVFAAAVQGGNHRRLTLGLDCRAPFPNADGRRVAMSCRGNVNGENTEYGPEIVLASETGLALLTQSSPSTRNAAAQLSADGRVAIFMSNGNYANENPFKKDHIFLWREGEALRQVTHTNEAVTGAQLSADGNIVLVLTALNAPDIVRSRHLSVYDLGHGTILDMGTLPTTEVSFSRDGEWVAYLMQGLHLVHISGRERETLAGRDARQFALNADATRFLFDNTTTPRGIPFDARFLTLDTAGGRLGFTSWDSVTYGGRQVYVLEVPSQQPSPTPGAGCHADCDWSGDVSGRELGLLLNRSLRDSSLLPCRRADMNQDGKITIEEVVTGAMLRTGSCQ